MKSVPPAFYAGDLYGELYDPDAPVARRRVIEFVPGLLLCATAALAAAWLAEHYSFPIILLGLLIGLALSFVSEVEVTAPGLDFSSRHFLRIGIVLLGAQVTFAQVGALGWLCFRRIAERDGGELCRRLAGCPLDGAGARGRHSGGWRDRHLRRFGGIGALWGDRQRAARPGALFGHAGGCGGGERHRHGRLSRAGRYPGAERPAGGLPDRCVGS